MDSLCKRREGAGRHRQDGQMIAVGGFGLCGIPEALIAGCCAIRASRT